MLNLLQFARLSWGKIRFGRFAPCKRFDISQLCVNKLSSSLDAIYELWKLCWLTCPMQMTHFWLILDFSTYWPLWSTYEELESLKLVNDLFEPYHLITLQNFSMTFFWGENLLSHWTSLGLADLLTLLYIGLLALFIYVTNRLFIGKLVFFCLIKTLQVFQMLSSSILSCYSFLCLLKTNPWAGHQMLKHRCRYWKTKCKLPFAKLQNC